MLSKNHITKLFIDISSSLLWHILSYRCFADVDAVPFVIPCSFDNHGDEVGSVSSSRIQFLFDPLTFPRNTGDSGLLGAWSEIEFC